MTPLLMGIVPGDNWMTSVALIVIVAIGFAIWNHRKGR